MFGHGDGGDGTVAGGVEETFFAIVTPDGIEAAGRGDLIAASAVGEMDDGDFAVAGGAVFVSDPITIRRKSRARRALIVGDDLEGFGIAGERKSPQTAMRSICRWRASEEKGFAIAAKRGSADGKAVEAEDGFFSATAGGTDFMNLCDVGGRRLDTGEEDGLAIGRPDGAGAVSLREGDLGAALKIHVPDSWDPLVGGTATESDGRAVGRNGRGGEEHVRRECRFFAGTIVPDEIGIFGVGLRGIVGKNAIVGGGEEGIAGGRKSADSVRKRNGIAGKFEGRGIEFLRKESVVANEEKVAGRNVEGVEDGGENEVRFGIVEGSDVESGGIGFIGTKDEDEVFAIGKKLRPTIADDAGGGSSLVAGAGVPPEAGTFAIAEIPPGAKMMVPSEFQQLPRPRLASATL